jgi:hypothetical protein
MQRGHLDHGVLDHVQERLVRRTPVDGFDDQLRKFRLGGEDDLLFGLEVVEQAATSSSVTASKPRSKNSRMASA